MSPVRVTEKHVESYLAKKAKAAGGISYKWSSPAFRGVPDRIVIVNRTVWFIEVKRPGGVLSPLQEYRIDELKGHGCNVTVLYSRRDVDEFFEKRKDEQERWARLCTS
jgi:hypothetical protein